MIGWRNYKVGLVVKMELCDGRQDILDLGGPGHDFQ